MLLVFTAVPGSESHERLRLLATIGSQDMSPARPAETGGTLEPVAR